MHRNGGRGRHTEVEALVPVDQLDDRNAQRSLSSTSCTREHGWTAPSGAFLELTCRWRKFAPADGSEADRCRDRLSYLGRRAGRSKSGQLGLSCLRWTSPYTALTGRPVGRVRGGPARAFDVESASPRPRDRFIYLTYGCGSQGAVAGGPRKSRGGFENPLLLGEEEGGKRVKLRYPHASCHKILGGTHGHGSYFIDIGIPSSCAQGASPYPSRPSNHRMSRLRTPLAHMSATS